MGQQMGMVLLFMEKASGLSYILFETDRSR